MAPPARGRSRKRLAHHTFTSPLPADRHPVSPTRRPSHRVFTNCGHTTCSKTPTTTPCSVYNLLLLDATMHWNPWPTRPTGILPLQCSEVSHTLHDPSSRSNHFKLQRCTAFRVTTHKIYPDFLWGHGSGRATASGGGGLLTSVTGTTSTRLGRGVLVNAERRAVREVQRVWQSPAHLKGCVVRKA